MEIFLYIEIQVKKCLNLNNSSSENFEFDKVLVSVGRKPFTEGLGLENINININKTGTIQVDKNFQTNVDPFQSAFRPNVKRR